MLNLTIYQRRQVARAAAALTPAARSAFIAVVESTLPRYCLGRAPSNTDVQRVIDYVLDAVPWPRSTTLLRFGFFWEVA
jgi:hypothetical protein